MPRKRSAQEEAIENVEIQDALIRHWEHQIEHAAEHRKYYEDIVEEAQQALHRFDRELAQAPLFLKKARAKRKQLIATGIHITEVKKVEALKRAIKRLEESIN